MRRTRLVAVAFASSVCLTALAPAAVASEPVAEVSPRRVHPGGTVTITVACGKHDEKVRHITAYSQAFAEGEAELKLVDGRSGSYGKATYRGSAKIAPARDFSGATGSSTHDDGYGPSGSEGSYRAEGSYGTDEGSGSSGSYRIDGSYGSGDDYGSGSGSDYGSGRDDSGDSYGSRHRGKAWGINGSCPDGSDFTTEVIVDRKPSGGAHAGQGGSQGEVNTAAVAAGGALLSATVGFGVYRLRRHRSGI